MVVAQKLPADSCGDIFAGACVCEKYSVIITRTQTSLTLYEIGNNDNGSDSF